MAWKHIEIFDLFNHEPNNITLFTIIYSHTSLSTNSLYIESDLPRIHTDR